MENIPVTKEDFRAIGERYNSTDVLKQADELIALARKYLSQLRGYDIIMLADLEGLRAKLHAMIVERQQQRQTEKVGSRKELDKLVREAKWLHREAVVVLRNAITTRVPAEGETEEQTRDILKLLMNALATEDVSIGRDSHQAQVRLEGLRRVIIGGDIERRFKELSGEDDYEAQINAMIPKLQNATETKSSAKQTALTDTADMDELDGRMYTNLKALVKAGRARFNRLGDPTRAALFNLSILNEPYKKKEEKKGEDAPGEAVVSEEETGAAE